jgi:hypothetical protein
MQLDWHKNTLGKSLVQSGAEGDAKRSWAACMKLLKQHIGMGKPGNLLNPDDCHAARETIPQESQAATWRRANSSSGVVAPATQQHFDSFKFIQLCLLAIAVLFLGLLLVVICTGVHVISQELHEIAEAASKGPSAGAAVCDCASATPSKALENLARVEL